MKLVNDSRIHLHGALKRFLGLGDRGLNDTSPTSLILPQEIILQVLGYFAAEARLHAQALFFSLLSGFWTNFLEPYPDSKGEAHFALHNVALLNRQWHLIAVELLYKHVILTSSQDIRLFRRTVGSSPLLAGLVRKVTLAGLDQRTYQLMVPQGRAYRKYLEFVKGG